MDLAKVNPRTIAALIVNGRRQLSEVPEGSRDVVAYHIESLKKDLRRKEYEKLKWPELQKVYKELSKNPTTKTAKAMIAELTEL